MTRRYVWIGLFVAALGLLGGLWFVTHFERVPYQRWESPGIEAIRNPYLALERFLRRMGHPMQQTRKADALDTLPPRSTLILNPGRGRHMTPERVDALLHWVEGGGYLIVAPEEIGSADPLLMRLGVSWHKARTNAEGESESEDTEAPPQSTVPAKLSRKTQDDGIEVRIPEQTPLRIRPDYRSLRSTRPTLWHAAAPEGGDRLLHFQRGTGHITVISNLGQILDNQTIGKLDHAEILSTLLDTYQPRGHVQLIRRLATPGLLEWLVENAWTALLGLAAALALWLWRVMPRFGVIAATPRADRRALGEHLSALGRYVWRAGGLDHWTTLARRHFQQRLALHHPALAALTLHEQADTLARQLGASHHEHREIATALHGPIVTPLDFTHALRTLRNLEHSLARGDLAREAGSAPHSERHS